MSFEYAEKTKHTYAEARQLKDRLTNGKVAIPLWFAMFFLWLNGSYWWPSAWEGQTALAYILMFTFTLAVTKDKLSMWVHSTSLTQGAVSFLLGFLLMFTGLLVMDTYVFNGTVSGAGISIVSFYPVLLLTMFFVAPVEETMFRGVMPEYFKGWHLWAIPLAPVITSAAFAVTHIFAYQGAVMSLQWAFVMGLVFYGVSRYSLFKGQRLGVPGSTGAHAAYNLFVLGVLTGVVA
jgi:membrane protease YdiL (CAAX protease family)